MPQNACEISQRPAWQSLHEWARGYARRAGFGTDAIEVIDALADKLAAASAGVVGAPREPSKAAVDVVTPHIVALFENLDAQAAIDCEPTARAIVWELLRAAYAVDFQAAQEAGGPEPTGGLPTVAQLAAWLKEYEIGNDPCDLGSLGHRTALAKWLLSRLGTL